MIFVSFSIKKIIVLLLCPLSPMLNPYAVEKLEIISVHFDIASQLLIIYFAFINYLRKNRNTIRQCISYSRKLMIQLGGKPGKVFLLSLVPL